MILIALAAVLSCVATDGDSLRCGDERVRLLGVDAPEMHGCPPERRQCAAGDPKASRANLNRLVDGKRVTVERLKKDRYGRTIAVASAGGVNLSCAQLRARHAEYVAAWDDGRRIARACRR